MRYSSFKEINIEAYINRYSHHTYTHTNFFKVSQKTLQPYTSAKIPVKLLHQHHPQSLKVTFIFTAL